MLTETTTLPALPARRLPSADETPSDAVRRIQAEQRALERFARSVRDITSELERDPTGLERKYPTTRARQLSAAIGRRRDELANDYIAARAAKAGVSLRQISDYSIEHGNMPWEQVLDHFDSQVTTRTPAARTVSASIRAIERPEHGARVTALPDGRYRVEIAGAERTPYVLTARELVAFQRELFPTARGAAARGTTAARTSSASTTPRTRATGRAPKAPTATKAPSASQAARTNPAARGARLARLQNQITARETRLEVLRNRLYLSRGEQSARGQRQRDAWTRQLQKLERVQAQARTQAERLTTRLASHG